MSREMDPERERWLNEAQRKADESWRKLTGGLTEEEWRALGDQEHQRLEEGVPSIDVLELSNRVYNRLKQEYVLTVAGVAQILAEGRRPFRFGPRSQEELRRSYERYIGQHDNSIP